MAALWAILREVEPDDAHAAVAALLGRHGVLAPYDQPLSIYDVQTVEALDAFVMATGKEVLASRQRRVVFGFLAERVGFVARLPEFERNQAMLDVVRNAMKSPSYRSPRFGM